MMRHQIFTGLSVDFYWTFSGLFGDSDWAITWLVNPDYLSGK